MRSGGIKPLHAQRRHRPGIVGERQGRDPARPPPMRKIAAVKQKRTDLGGKIGLIGHHLDAVAAEIPGEAPDRQPGGRILGVVIENELALAVTPPHAVKAIDHRRLGGGIEIQRRGEAGAVFGPGPCQHPCRGRPHRCGLPCQGIAAQVLDDALPGERPMGGDVVDHPSCRQNLDIGPKLVVPYLRPGRGKGGGSRAQYEQQRKAGSPRPSSAGHRFGSLGAGTIRGLRGCRNPGRSAGQLRIGIQSRPFSTRRAQRALEPP